MPSPVKRSVDNGNCYFLFFSVKFLADKANNKQPNRKKYNNLDTMFKSPDHQVAGHSANEGRLGPLVDESGNFYKPLQDGERGSREVAFYASFSSAKVPSNIRNFFPIFYGTKLLEASDGLGPRPHIILQDLISHWPTPAVMDIKIGSRTWYPQASDEYIKRCLQKDRKTTSLSLGFRICGLQVPISKESESWKPEKKVVQGYNIDDVSLVLRKFVSSNSGSGPDCRFAPTVYGGPTGILRQLLKLKAWFEDQTLYHFNSCSILMFYDRDSVLKGGESGAEIKLIDFAHVVEGKGVIDHNFLGGLCSLIKFISDILATKTDGSTNNPGEAMRLGSE